MFTLGSRFRDDALSFGNVHRNGVVVSLLLVPALRHGADFWFLGLGQADRRERKKTKRIEITFNLLLGRVNLLNIRVPLMGL